MNMRSRASGSPDATRAVDWEQRIDFPRLRQDRLDRAKAALEASDLGSAPRMSRVKRAFLSRAHSPMCVLVT